MPNMSATRPSSAEILPMPWGSSPPSAIARQRLPQRTTRKFDEMCLTPVQGMTPEDIRALRLREQASQAVFARHLNVTTGLVSQWERGEKRPRGTCLKLLALVAKKGLGAVA